MQAPSNGKRSLRDVILDWRDVRRATGPGGEAEAAAAIRKCYEMVKMKPPEVAFAADPHDAREMMNVLGGPQQAITNAVFKFPSIYVNDWLMMNVEANVLTRIAAEIRNEQNLELTTLVPSYAVPGQWMEKLPVLRGYLQGRLVSRNASSVTLEWLEAFDAISRGCAYWIPLEEYAIAVPRASMYHIEDVPFRRTPRLHRVGGPAIEWPTGRGHNVVHGIPLPDWAWDREVMTAGLIIEQPNMEVRRELVKIYGAAQFAMDLGAELVATDDWGKLWRAPAADDAFDMLIVEALNSTPEPDGTYKTYYWRVAPDLTPAGSFVARPQKLTPLNAIASSFGMTGKEYLAHVGQQT